MHVEALILAEGGSNRLRPLTDHLPACLVPVGGTPILDHEIQTLRGVGVDHVTVVGGYRAAQVEQACRFYDVVRFRMNPSFSRENPRLAAMRAAGPLAGGPLLLLRGELIFDGALLSELLRSGSPNVAVTDQAGEPVGLWKLSPRAAEALFAASLEDQDGVALDEALRGVLEGLGVEPLEPTRPWASVRSMEDLARALHAHRLASEAHVARHQERLLAAGRSVPRVPAAMLKTPPPKSPPPPPWVASSLKAAHP